MRFEVEVHRPWSLLSMCLCAGLFVAWAHGAVNVTIGNPAPTTASLGGNETETVRELVEAEGVVKQAREERAVLERQEEILRHQLQVVQTALEAGGYDEQDPEGEDLRKTSRKLVSLLQDKQRAESHLHAALQELWDAQERAGRIITEVRGRTQQLQWPVDPALGVSADFMDPGYEALFGLPHKAIDIPTEQGTPIRAPADGVVEKIVDNGYGYSYLIVKHSALVTLYGHVDTFIVAEGDKIRLGEVMALSGGRPGSRGAGSLSTGPHLHFEVLQDGKNIDPRTVLPQL